MQLGDEGVGEDKTDETSNQLSEVCIEDEVTCPENICKLVDGSCCDTFRMNFLYDGTVECCKYGSLSGDGVCPLPEDLATGADASADGGTEPDGDW